MNLYMDLALGSRQPCARLSKMSRPICQRLQRLSIRRSDKRALFPLHSLR